MLRNRLIAVEEWIDYYNLKDAGPMCDEVVLGSSRPRPAVQLVSQGRPKLWKYHGPPHRWWVQAKDRTPLAEISSPDTGHTFSTRSTNCGELSRTLPLTKGGWIQQTSSEGRCSAFLRTTSGRLLSSDSKKSAPMDKPRAMPEGSATTAGSLLGRAPVCCNTPRAGSRHPALADQSAISASHRGTALSGSMSYLLAASGPSLHYRSRKGCRTVSYCKRISGECFYF